ncbi:helix-turn-helix domain-containing protein [Formosa sp. A9]|uniref:helix-turn-helix domain-containing protein n=1 Tax=Formosa sp. A9 TaxID=3442641 RepID=UPI003EC02C6F
MLKIKELLKHQGKTQKDLANELNITPIGLNKLINGNPTLETLQRIATVLDVEVLDLFESKDSDKQKVLYIKENGEFIPVGKINLF